MLPVRLSVAKVQVLRLSEYLPAPLFAAACTKLNVLCDDAFVKQLGVLWKRKADFDAVVKCTKKFLKEP